MNNAGHVRCLIYVFSAETVTKMNKKIKNKSLSYDLQHEWFNDWFDKVNLNSRFHDFLQNLKKNLFYGKILINFVKKAICSTIVSY
jgi:hypothetical protein